MSDNSILLINEYPLQMLPSLAVALNGENDNGGNRNGDRKALFIQQVHYWMQKAKQSKGKMGKFEDGRWWIYNSLTEWQQDNFPMWSRSTVERLITELRDTDGVLLCHVEGAGRSAKSWFSIDYDALNALLIKLRHSDVDWREPETTTETTSDNFTPRPPALGDSRGNIASLFDMQAGQVITRTIEPTGEDDSEDDAEWTGLEIAIMHLLKSQQSYRC